MERKVTEHELRERLHLLWMAGDAAIMSDYRDVTSDELWEEYGWVANQSADLFDFLRGDTAELAQRTATPKLVPGLLEGTMNKHTPGPWTMATGADGSALVTSPHDRGGIDDDVCLVYGGNDSDPEAMSANARLIAAAPELLGLAREVAEVAETVAALLCSPGEATRAELVSVITDIGARAAALVNDAVKEEA